ncbi:MAG: sensor domain-containing protein [Acidimicrobiales bacterium]
MPAYPGPSWRELAALVADGIWVVDANGKTTYANEPMAALVGSSPGELTASRLFGLGDTKAEELERRLKTKRSGSKSIPLGIPCRDGSSLRARALPLYRKGRYVGAMAVVSPPTSAAQDAGSDQSGADYQAVFGQSPVAMAKISIDGHLVAMNDALVSLVGSTRSVLSGRTLVELTHPDDAAETGEALAELASGAISSHRGEQRLLARNRDPIWVSLFAQAVSYGDDKIDHVLVHFLDIADRKRVEDQLRHSTRHDSLTGLFNRTGFEEELDRQAERSSRHGAAGGLLVLDLDGFKEINDVLGHGAGDAVLVSISEVLRRWVRSTDVVARLGGDEFAVLLPYADRADAEHVASKLLRAIREHGAVLPDGHSLRITTSIGVALFDDTELSGEAVLGRADLTMYSAKDAGRDQVAVFESGSELRPTTKSRLAWVERIALALAEDGFSLFAQPIIDLRSASISRYELLIRMLDDGNIIGPNEFLHVAERNDLAGRIDTWVAGRAIDLLAGDEFPAQAEIEVNLSGYSLGDAGLLSFLRKRFAESGADPSRLVFEIAETAAVSNISLAREFAEAVADIGCKFALDDFGAGFGSFSYLKHLPFDYVKIDGEFVAACLVSATDRLIIESIVTIATGLGKETVAEHVADGHTMRFLERLGVDFAQGYYIGRPAPLEQLLEQVGTGTASQRWAPSV